MAQLVRESSLLPAWMAITLLSFHNIAILQVQQFSFHSLFTMIICLIPVTIPLPTDIQQGWVLHHWMSLLCFPFHGFVNYHTMSFSEGIRSSLGSSSRGAGSIFRPRAISQRAKTLLLGCVGDLGADLMLTAGDPSILKQAVCGSACLQDPPIVHSEKV